MTGPGSLLFNFIVADVEILKFRALEANKLGEFIVWQIQPLKVLEVLFISENGNILDLVFRDVKFYEVCELSHNRDINDIVVLKV